MRLWNLRILYRPMLIGGVFKAVGNVPNMTIPNKRAFMLQDLERMRESYDLPITVNKVRRNALHV